MVTKKNGNGHKGEAVKDATVVALPEQKEFFKIPARFGHVPVAEEPLGYDKERRFEHHFPRIELPFQPVDTIETAVGKRFEQSEVFPNGLNRLFFGDCLHVMRMLPSESIDLIYIDPPFFSGRNYNILFGDKNEVRSFSDIWEGGMPGYIIWLNARLYEMKRLLKPSGSIYVHLDWHASHYIKCEMDKLYGYNNFRNEVIWAYKSGGASQKPYAKKHDVINFYSTSNHYTFNQQKEKSYMGKDYNTGNQNVVLYKDDNLEHLGPYTLVNMKDWWPDIGMLATSAKERIGYPTQKPEALIERIIKTSSNEGDVVADFFCGGGTTCSVAQKLGRKWIGCDISRVAIALTADRIARILAPNLDDIRRAKKKKTMNKSDGLFDFITDNPTMTSVEDKKKKAVADSLMPLTGYTVEHWGIYEINRLTKLSTEDFRKFVVACYGARKWTGADDNIHGVKGNQLPKETDVITAQDVKKFAEAVMKSRKPEERDTVMIGWGIDPKAKDYATQIMALGEKKPIQFIMLRLWPLAGEEFKSHVTRKHSKYKDFLAFILPPDIPRIGVKRISSMKYEFDVSEARSMNIGGNIVNVQWDFDFRDGIFSASQGYSLCRKEKKGKGENGYEGETKVEFNFEDVEPGTEVSIACRVQDDLGGEGMKIMKVKVE